MLVADGVRIMKIVHRGWLVPALLVLGSLPAAAQGGSAVDALAARLERLEQQNVALLEQLQTLRRELEDVKRGGAEDAPPVIERIEVLEEGAELQGRRLSEQAQVKVESSQRVPIRLTGMVLFNAFLNTPHGSGAGVDYPISARVDRARPNTAATLRRSVVGLEFETPEALGGGRFGGSFFIDMTQDGDALSNIQPRLRTAGVEGRWTRWAVFAGQDKPILSPREPSSLAQVQFAPLTGAGNFWLWRPQVRVERLVSLGQGAELRARIGVSQAPETGGATPQELRATLEPRRPALEGHFQVAFQGEGVRRVEVGSGFHTSKTHVAGTSVPADVVTVDWFVKPFRTIELTGALFAGRNLSKLGSGAAAQGIAIRTLSSGEARIVPVKRRGGWTQLTVLPVRRLTVNLQAGFDNPDDRDLLSTSMTRNVALVANTFYRLAPNVVGGVELAQVRTWYKAGQRPRYNHYDFYLAYLF